MAEKRTRLHAWIWAIALMALIAAAVLLVTGKQWRDPPEVYRFDTTELRDTGDTPVLFEEVESLDPGLKKISALAVSTDGRIFAAGGKECVVFSGDGAEVNQIALDVSPQCLAIAPDGELVIGAEKEVLALNAEGVVRFRTGELDKEAYITSVAVNENAIFAADAGRRVVLRFDREGKLPGRIGEKDPERDIPGLVIPSPYCDVALDSDGALWVVNPGRHGLEQYRPDGSLVTSWYRASMMLWGFSGCCNPAHIAFWKDEGLITAEKGVDRLKLYRLDWSLAGLVAPPEVFAVSAESDMTDDLSSPFADIAVDAEGRVLVADRRRNLIRIFEFKDVDAASLPRSGNGK